jgi:hypothetical protein
MRSAKSTCGSHAKPTRTMAPAAIVACMLHAVTKAPRATTPASHAAAFLREAGTSMTAALPAKGKAISSNSNARSVIETGTLLCWGPQAETDTITQPLGRGTCNREHAFVRSGSRSGAEHDVAGTFAWGVAAARSGELMVTPGVAVTLSHGSVLPSAIRMEVGEARNPHLATLFGISCASSTSVRVTAKEGDPRDIHPPMAHIGAADKTRVHPGRTRTRTRDIGCFSAGSATVSAGCVSRNKLPKKAERSLLGLGGSAAKGSSFPQLTKHPAGGDKRARSLSCVR